MVKRDYYRDVIKTKKCNRDKYYKDPRKDKIKKV